MSLPIMYDPETFSSLPTFEEATANLAEHESQLPALAATVSHYDRDGVVGLALLHRHFDLENDERLVETVDVEGRCTIGKPSRVEDVDAIAPHLFRVVKSPSGYEWRALEFVRIPGGREGTAKDSWLAEQDELLQVLGAELERIGALSAVGISLEHGRQEIPVEEDEVLVESTDQLNRILIMRPAALSQLQGITTPTNWSVKDGEIRMRCTCQKDWQGSHSHFETN